MRSTASAPHSPCFHARLARALAACLLLAAGLEAGEARSVTLRPPASVPLHAAATATAPVPTPAGTSTSTSAGSSFTTPATTPTGTPVSAAAAAFDGWGTSLCWFANAVGRWPEPARSRLADALFAESGLGLTVVRYNIGGGEQPGHQHMPWFRQMEGFQDASGAWNWAADPGQRWMLKAALSRGAQRVEAFSNSPPYWMTRSGCASGAVDKNSDNLDPSKEAAFITYLVRVVKQLQTADGVHFDTLDPMNEPWTDYWKAMGHQEGCHFDLASQARLLRALRAHLDREGLADLKLSASDETNYEKAIEAWNSYDAATRSCVAVVNSHSYSTQRRTELRALIAESGKPLVMSEVDDGGGQPHDHQSMRPALQMAAQIVDDLRDLRPLRWVFWQAVEDEAGQAGSNNNWGLVHADLEGDSHSWNLTKKYHAFAQFTRHIRPGALVLDCETPGLVAALDPARRQLVVVFCNVRDEEQSLHLDLSAFGVVDSDVATVRTSAQEDQLRLPDRQASQGFLGLSAAARSVTTFTISLPGSAPHQSAHPAR